MRPEPIILDPAFTTLDDPTPYVEKGVVCIPLPNGMVALVDEADYHLVAGFKWNATTNPRSRTWYAHTMIVKGTYWSDGYLNLTMHKMIMPGVPQVDHRDLNGLNNSRSNLRPATESQNKFNTAKRSGTLSRYRGIYFDKRGARCNPWAARIKVDGAHRALGCFATEELAAHAYDNAAREIAGEFARLNFPNDPIWLPLPDAAPMCRNGHERTPENIYCYTGGWLCRKCRDERYRRKVSAIT